MGKEHKLRRNCDRVRTLTRICTRLELFDWNNHPPHAKWGTYGYLSRIEDLFIQMWRGKADKKLAAAEEIDRRQLWWILYDDD